jgi:gas vesicle protein GvpL/GvpF
MKPSKALYLYGVVDHREVPAVLEEFKMANPVRCLPIGDLGALIRDVAVEEFGEEALKERLKDPKWLEQHLWHHERVLEAAMRSGTIIPMKFLTIFRTEERLLKSLWALYETLRGLCGKLKSKEEWGVKAFCDPRCIEAVVEAQCDKVKQLKARLAGKSLGTAYLMRKQLEEWIKRESALRLGVDLDSISCRLSAVAPEIKLNPATQELTNHQMVLNAALLVNKTSVSTLADAVVALRQEYVPHGLQFELVGPFPPYNFSELPTRAERSETGRREDP